MFNRVIQLAKTLGLKAPVLIQAPMAGGITTPQLVAAVSNAGGLGSFATGYLTTDAVRRGVAEIKQLTTRPFAVNVFIPNHPMSSLNIQHITQYQLALNQFRRDLKLPEETHIPETLVPKDNLSEMIDVILQEQIKICSFTFGNLPEATIRRLKQHDVYLIGTATSLEEAKILAATGIDAIVAQGYEAGGHRGGFLTPEKSALIGTMALIPQLTQHIEKPIIAAGGIMRGSSAIAAISLGASGVQMGTAFLATQESGAALCYQAALKQRQYENRDVTTLTSAYSGKTARGIETAFIQHIADHVDHIPPYPIPNTLSSPIRKEALKQQQPHMMSLWCGQGISDITHGLTAGALLEKLRSEMSVSLMHLSTLQQQLSKGNHMLRDTLLTPEQPVHGSIRINKKLVAISLAGAAIVNGALYFAVAVEGGENIQTLFDMSDSATKTMSLAVGSGASVVYTMFMYKTLEALSLKINTPSKAFFSLLAPFSAAAFLTAGTAGAELIGCNAPTALAIGVALFGLRMINCIDASVKFPHRLKETRRAWNEAWHEKDYRELSRLLAVWLSSIGYVACTTDAIYSATQTIAGWFAVSQGIVPGISLAASLLGAAGTLPLNVYWSHRGLRQLTGSGKRDANGHNPDPTDLYTYLGLILVLPVILGIVGGATASTGEVFGQLGPSADVLRLITSILYAVFAGTPGMATLLRGMSQYARQLALQHGSAREESTPLLAVDSHHTATPITSRLGIFSGKKSLPINHCPSLPPTFSRLQEKGAC